MNKILFLADTTTMITRFLIYGTVGWCLEIFWTGLLAGFKGNKTLSGSTSLWMFPIYGCAAFLAPVSRLLKNTSVFFRGITYMSCIFSAEFVSGTLLKRHGFCPWDYGQSRFNIKRVIRLDYAPFWFLAGLLFEKLVQPPKSESF